MRILFLHGRQSVPGGVKPTFLAQHGHEVINPALPEEDFTEAVRIAQAEFDKHRPDVVVGSSRGGAVAMNLDSGDTPLVLLCPAWRKPRPEERHRGKEDVRRHRLPSQRQHTRGSLEGSLIVRLGDEQGEEALLEPHVKPFDITGKAMKGWAMVTPEGIEADSQLKEWIQRAVKVVGRMPAKKK